MISLVTLLAASAALAAPVEERQAKTVALPVKRVSNFSSVKNLVSKGQARLDKVNAASEVSSGSVTNEDVSYVAAVTIGGTSYDLIVDTGCM
jgi:predicted aspartyl protease